MPFVASAAATGILANYVFNPQFGVANKALRRLGLPTQQFLENPHQALLVICVIALWGEIGFTAVIYLAALQDIPRELVEAATVDGASRWQVFRHVTLPQLRAGHGLRRGLADDHRAAAVRPRLHDDPGRAAATRTADDRLLRLRAGVPDPAATATARPSPTSCSPSRCCSRVGMIWYSRRSEDGGVLMADRIPTPARRRLAGCRSARGTCC